MSKLRWMPYFATLHLGGGGGLPKFTGLGKPKFFGWPPAPLIFGTPNFRVHQIFFSSVNLYRASIILPDNIVTIAFRARNPWNFGRKNAHLGVFSVSARYLLEAAESISNNYYILGLYSKKA